MMADLEEIGHASLHRSAAGTSAYGVDRLRSGVQQAYDYAGDSGGAGYLMIFNFADRPLELPNDDSEARWPRGSRIRSRTAAAARSRDSRSRCGCSRCGGSS